MVRELRSKSTSPQLLVDAGNLLFKKDETGNNPVSAITAHGIVRAYSKIAYNAVAVGPQDLSAGDEFFKDSMKIGFPWISANIFDGDGKPVFPAAVIVKRTDAPDVGIIGLTGNGNSPSWARIGDWREALPRQLTNLTPTCGMIILLSNLSDAENLEIAEHYPRIQIIVTSSPTRYGNQPPQLVHSSLITQGDGRGKYLGKMEIKWHPDGHWLTNASSETQENQQDNPAVSNSFAAEFLPIRPQPSAGDVDAIIQDINKSIGAYQKIRLGQNGATDQRTGETLQLARFSGIEACKGCHQKQTAFWAETGHASAFATLVKTGQNYNPDCLPCHVTAGNISSISSFAEKDLLLVLPENRQMVGCETCHGQGRQHSLNPEQNQAERKPTERKCMTCHTPEHDDSFNYAKKISLIACPSGN